MENYKMKKSLLLIITLSMSVLLFSCKTDTSKTPVPQTETTAGVSIGFYTLEKLSVYCSKDSGRTYNLYASYGFTDYIWYIDGVKIDETGNDVYYTFDEPGVYEVFVTAKKNNCLYSDTKYIEIK